MLSGLLGSSIGSSLSRRFRPGDEALALAGADLDPKCRTQTADRIVDPDARADQLPARCDHGFNPMRGGGLHIDFPVEPGAGELSQARRIMRISLVGFIAFRLRCA